MRHGPRSDAVGNVAVGDLLGGRYRLERRVGMGGMATIFLGRDETLERSVAVKVLHPHLADEPSVLARFRTEGRHAAALSHPHVVHVYDQGSADLPYLVMEYVDGPSLREILAERGALSPRETLTIVEPICRALGRAHAAGLIHRDIKPENVLVAADGTVKLADFGIARALEGTHHTQTGALIGSVHYVAPEIVAGLPADAATDQYGLGVLLFELLTGRKPLPAESPMAVALRHGREPIPAPSTFDPAVSAAMDAVVARAAALDPASRFPDVATLAAALRAAVPEGPAPLALTSGRADGSERTLVIPAQGRRAGEDRRTPAPPAANGRATTTTTAAPPSGRSGDTDEFPAIGTARAQPGRAPDRREDVPARPRARRGRRAAFLLATFLLIAALAAGGTLAARQLLEVPLQTVPWLGGLDGAAARAELIPLELDMTVAGEEHSRTVPEGVVMSQDPPAGTEIPSGESVGVVVSAGPAPVDMPHVEGGTFEEAAATLEGDPHYFRVRRSDFFHDHVPAGHVIAQAPERGRTLRQGAAVDLAVSKGIEQVAVPDLSGFEREEVEDAIAEAKLNVAFGEAYSDEVPEAGKVVSQSLAAGDEVDKGSLVEVTLSRGRLTIELPRVEGEDVEDATRELRALDLQVRVIEESRPRIGPFRRGRFGRVEAQDPQPGTAVQRGQTIDLYTFTEAAEDDDD
jgi:serine/threonine-protein kinase